VSEAASQIGVVGLGTMGAALARNLAGRGHRVAVYNKTHARAHELAERHPEAKLAPADTWKELVAALARPRRLLLLVPSGDPVDSVLDDLAPLLEEGDVVVDGGNSHYAETDRRIGRAASEPWDFVGMGVSGGDEGALTGPSMMPGGEPAAYERLRPLLESIAAESDSGPCVTWCGHGSAGHFVKMVHNGIEYGDMQLIAEAAVLLRRGLGLDAAEVAGVFAAWNAGDLESFLVEITADIYHTPDPEKRAERANDGDDGEALLLDAIEDRAGQKGTGRWTAVSALELAVAVPTIVAAVDARVLSAQKELRVDAEAAFGGRRDPRLEGIAPDDVAAALYASKIASYAQGFELLRRASDERGYETDLSEVARIWKAGCIIRARFLDPVREAFRGEAPRLLALAPAFRDGLRERLPAWRKVVAAAQGAGFAVPGLSASLAWFDTLTTARGSANLIQAQRDYFGSHTYERTDRPGESFHTDWREEMRRR